MKICLRGRRAVLLLFGNYAQILKSKPPSAPKVEGRCPVSDPFPSIAIFAAPVSTSASPAQSTAVPNTPARSLFRVLHATLGLSSSRTLVQLLRASSIDLLQSFPIQPVHPFVRPPPLYSALILLSLVPCLPSSFRSIAISLHDTAWRSHVCTLAILLQLPRMDQGRSVAMREGHSTFWPTTLNSKLWAKRLFCR